MEQLVRVARTLREEHRFRGYIHLKTIPEASPDLIAQAGRYADRLSCNVELPREAGLERLAPREEPGRDPADPGGDPARRIEAARAEGRPERASPRPGRARR